MNTKIKELLALIQDNPTLIVLPMVNTECVGSDDYTYWANSWGKAEIDEYYTSDERIYFKSTDYDELVDEYLDGLDNSESVDQGEYDECAKVYVEGLNWIKAIVVHIETL